MIEKSGGGSRRKGREEIDEKVGDGKFQLLEQTRYRWRKRMNVE